MPLLFEWDPAKARTNVVVLDPDVAGLFPDHDSVNEALRHLAAVIKRQQKAKKQRSRDADPSRR